MQVSRVEARVIGSLAGLGRTRVTGRSQVMGCLGVMGRSRVTGRSRVKEKMQAGWLMRFGPRESSGSGPT